MISSHPLSWFSPFEMLIGWIFELFGSVLIKGFTTFHLYFFMLLCEFLSRAPSSLIFSVHPCSFCYHTFVKALFWQSPFWFSINFFLPTSAFFMDFAFFSFPENIHCMYLRKHFKVCLH